MLTAMSINVLGRGLFRSPRASNRGVKIIRVSLDADPPAATLDCGYGGRAAACGVIKDKLARVGVRADEVFEEGDGLLGGVPRVFVPNRHIQ